MDDIFSIDILYANVYIPEDLYKLVRNGLCSQLDARLHELPNSIEYLTALICDGEERLSLLMLAALNGYDDVVRVLLTHCNPVDQIELKGIIGISNGKCIDGATALYCACYRKHFIVAKTLIEFGKANINQDTYEYPYCPLLIHATEMNRLDIVQFLVENRYSDINETKSEDINECTALTWAAGRGYIPLVEYLIANGADVNYSCKGPNLTARTPLSYATLAGHVEVVRLLYEAGADINKKNDLADTPLITACKKRDYSIIHFLLEQCIHTPEDIELAACTLIDISSSIVQSHEVLKLLRLAVQQRELMHIPKVCIQPIAAYDYNRECQTIDELDAIEDDPNRIFIETLLIRERILLSQKDITIMKPLHHYGDLLVEREEYDKCLHVWIHMFYLYQQMGLGTFLHRFVWIFCKMLTANRPIPVAHFLQVIQLIFEPSQMKEIDLTLINTVYLVILATKVLKQQEITRQEQIDIYHWIKDVCRRQFIATDGRTLLHLCVDIRINEYLSFRTIDTSPHLKSPNESALRLLLTCGGHWLDIDTIETSDGNTPLHLICKSTENRTIIELLVNSGAHIDCVNKSANMPLNYLRNTSLRALLISKSTPPNLKCLCARIIANQRLNIDTLGATTSTLSKFILLHGGSLTYSE